MNVEAIVAEEARKRIRSKIKRDIQLRDAMITKYKLKISTDLGVTYPYEMTASVTFPLQKAALELEKKGEVRWVIVDGNNDEVIHWCQYHEANLRVPPDSVLATDDLYMAQLAKRHGFKVMTSADVLRQFGIENPEEKLASVKFDAETIKGAFAYMKELIDEGVIEVVPCGLETEKIGKELFGDRS